MWKIGSCIRLKIERSWVGFPVLVTCRSVGKIADLVVRLSTPVVMAVSWTKLSCIVVIGSCYRKCAELSPEELDSNHMFQY